MPSPAPRRLRRFLPVVVLVAVALAAFVGWRHYGSDKSAVSYRTANVEKGDLRVAISATGALKALSTVDIGSQISGQVSEVLADFNDRVERGQIIARIDPANFEARLTQTRANLSSARASLQEAQAALRNAEADYNRKQELAQRQLVSRSEIDLAVAAREQAIARVASARAQIEQAQASVANAELELDYTVIRSPVDGVVLSRTVEPGQTVAASFQSPVLFQIAEDLAQMQIELSVDESDVGQIRAGQPVKFSVDAFSGREFSGDVRQVRLSATNQQNVITYPVVISVDNRDLTLLPGLTANANIEVSQRRDVLRVPNAALRFRPADAPAENPMRGMFAAFNIAPELPALVESLGPSADQKAAFERDFAAARERAEQARQRAQQGAGGGPPAGAVVMQGGPGGGGMPSQAQMAGMMAGRIKEGYADFMASLDAGQRQRFEQGINELLNARPITVWLLQDGKPVQANARAGLSDATHTELIGAAVPEGARVIIAAEGGA
ncbi:MAG: efflux RND transporter periplasmic adaptor subunit [Aquimonas sp.]|nr:efflux RND transporter periplasmic adaptor subunit [Aquimonas sp.]